MAKHWMEIAHSHDLQFLLQCAANSAAIESSHEPFEAACLALQKENKVFLLFTLHF